MADSISDSVLSPLIATYVGLIEHHQAERDELRIIRDTLAGECLKLRNELTESLKERDRLRTRAEAAEASVKAMRGVMHALADRAIEAERKVAVANEKAVGGTRPKQCPRCESFHISLYGDGTPYCRTCGNVEFPKRYRIDP